MCTHIPENYYKHHCDSPVEVRYNSKVSIYDLERGVTMDRIKKEVAFSIIKEMTESQITKMFNIKVLDPRQSFVNFSEGARGDSQLSVLRDKFFELKAMRQIEVSSNYFLPNGS